MNPSSSDSGLRIIDLSIRRPIFILMVFSAMIITGIIGYTRLGVELFPNVEFPLVVVQVVYPGASNVDIEATVTRPIEDSVSSINKIESIRSTSSEGVSTIIVEFNLDADVKDSENRVRQELSKIRRTLPDEIEEPLLFRFDFGAMPVLYYGVFSNFEPGVPNSNKEYELWQLRSIVEDFIKDRIQQINGVGSVTINGGSPLQVKIKLDLEKLKSRGISIQEITQIIKLANMNVPVGKIEGSNLDIPLRVEGQFTNLEEIRNLVLRKIPVGTGSNQYYSTITLGDVAEILFEEEENHTISRLQGRPGIVFSVTKQSGMNTVQVANDVVKEIEKIRNSPSIPPNLEIIPISNTATYIEKSIRSVTEHLFEGAILAVIVVFIFMWNLRSTIITGLALPNSIIGTFLFLWILGYTQNFMTMLALTLAIGLLIDDAIVMRENIFRHLEMGKKPYQAALEGAKEVSLAVLSTSGTILAVFMPVAFMGGVVGKFFTQFGITVCIAMIISMLDAFTMAPLLSSRFLESSHTQKTGMISRISAFFAEQWNLGFDFIKQVYSRILDWALDHKVMVVAIAIVSFAISMALFFQMGFNFQGEEDEPEFLIMIETAPGSPLSHTDQKIHLIEQMLDELPYIKFHLSVVGTEGEESNQGQIIAVLTDYRQRSISSSQAQSILREKLSTIPGILTTVKLMRSGSGTKDPSQMPLSISITNTSNEVLEKDTLTLFNKMKNMPGITDLDSTVKLGKMETRILFDAGLTKDFNVHPVAIAQEMMYAIEGNAVSKFRIDEDEFDIFLQLKESDRENLEKISMFALKNSQNQSIDLRNVAHFENQASTPVIRRFDRSRITYVGANILPTSNMSKVQQLVNTSVDDLKKNNEISQSTTIEYGGQAERLQELLDNILLALGLAFTFIYLILASLYNSFLHPFTILISVPLSFIGAILAMIITQKTMDIYGFIGLILLIGLVTKNAILLIDYANNLRKKGETCIQAIRKSGPVRLRPILMTTFALIFGMIPIALGLGEGGAGRASLAIIVIGGLISSTLLTLVFVPVIYILFDQLWNWSTKNIFHQKQETLI